MYIKTVKKLKLHNYTFLYYYHMLVCVNVYTINN